MIAADITIEPLETHPALIPLLARWYHDAWHDLEGLPLEVLEAELALHLAVPGRTGTTWLAFAGDRPVGTVSVDVADLADHPHLGPWLASLYVVGDRRGAGIARALIATAQQHTVREGGDGLFLWTAGATRLYEASGFTRYGQSTLAGRQIVLMRWQAARG